MAERLASTGKESGLPQWIRLLPLGKVELVDRREPFEVDQESLATMVTDFRARGVDLVIDYEHQSLGRERAPAAGWIKDLEAREDGLWARVEWTPQAQEYLRNREYRYFSPVLRLDPETRNPVTLMQVGLTNVPAIKGLAPLVAKCGGESSPGEVRLAALEMGLGEEDTRKMMEKLKSLVGLSPEAQDEVVGSTVLEVFRDLVAALELPEDASVSQVKGAVAALKAGSHRFTEMQEELKTLRSRLAEEAAAQAVAEALKAGKITPAQKEWALQYFRQDQEGFQTYVAKAPQLVPTGVALRFLGEDHPGGKLAPEDLAVCRSLNITPEAYLKAKA